MKTFIAFLLSALFAFAGEINWLDNLNDAKALAKKEHKAVLFMISSPTCGICNMMKKHVFTDDGIIKRQNKDYVSIVLELGFDDIPKEYEVFGTPTFYIFDKKGTQIENKIGGSNVKGWNKFLDSLQWKL